MIVKGKIGLFAVLSAVVLLAVSAAAFAGGSADNMYGKIDAYLSETVPKTHFPSLSITIVDGGETLFSKSYGNVSTDAPYVLGSVSKSFTALCIMQMVEQGKVSLEAHLSDYLPDAAHGEKITIIQLLNHTSGLGEHQNLTNFGVVNEQGVHLYSNVNYSLLGKVIEAVSGMSYEEYVTENIFRPLNMNSTSADPAKASGLIDGYENWFGFNVKTAVKYRDTENAWITAPAGYISSSTEDLGRYLQMYLNGGEGIISAESINEMFYNGVAVEDEIPYSYGMGWTLTKEPLKRPVLRHSGLVENGMSCIFILPEDDIGVAIAVNTNDYFVGADFADRVGWGVVLMLMGDEPNRIGSGGYALRHLMYDGIYITVLIISVLPLFFIGKYKMCIRKRSGWKNAAVMSAFHAVLPVFILAVPRIFFGTPLWVVKAFVPDLFVTIIVSAGMLFAGGVVKVIILIRGTDYSERIHRD